MEHEGPGYLQDFLSRMGIPFELICIDKNESVPDCVENTSGLVFMGGPMSVHDAIPWIEDEIQLIKMAVGNGIPVLGHCLGGQLIARALGADVIANKVSEIGWHATYKIDSPESSSWLKGINDKVELFHWHSETFSLPDGGSPILKSAHCENQGFVKGPTLALQCHIEMTEAMVVSWAEIGNDNIVQSESVQSAEEMTKSLPERINKLNQIADIIYKNWANGLK